MNDELPNEVNDFLLSDLNLSQLKDWHDANVKLLGIRNKDYAWRVKWRGPFGWTVMGIIVGQHLFVFGLIVLSIICGFLNEIQWLLVSFFGGLLAETYFTLNYVIKWLFSEIPYKFLKTSK